MPLANNTYEFGSSGNAVAGGYTVTAFTTTSDARAKANIQDSDLGLSFVMACKPKSYKLVTKKMTNDEAPVAIAGERTHYGFIAQEVKQALTASTTNDAAIWCLADPKDPTSGQSLRYEEMIAAAYKAIQELQGQVIALQTQLNSGVK